MRIQFQGRASYSPPSYDEADDRAEERLTEKRARWCAAYAAAMAGLRDPQDKSAPNLADYSVTESTTDQMLLILAHACADAADEREKHRRAGSMADALAASIARAYADAEWQNHQPGDDTDAPAYVEWLQ